LPHRIQPRRAATSQSSDEADGILDPVMRHLYKVARSKESA
jgi:hypothetical protein